MSVNDSDTPKQPRFVRLGDLAVAVPIFHLVCASLFLVGYCWFFGSRISSFVGPSDVFAVSIGEVGPLYLFTLLPPLAYILWQRAKKGAWTSAEAVALEPAGPKREIARKRHESDKRFYKVMFSFLLASQILGIIIGYFRWGYVPLVYVQTIVLFAFAISNVWIANKLDIASPIFHLTYLIGVLLLYACFAGMARAQSDLRISYEDALSRAPRCNDYVILRKFSEQFLVVRRDGKHSIVDESCSEKFVLPT